MYFPASGSGFWSRFTGAELELWEFFPPFLMTLCQTQWWFWVCGNFSHHCVWHRVITNGGKNSHKPSSASVNLDQNPDPEAGKSINILPPAPLLSCSLSVKEVGTKDGTRLVHKLIQRLVPMTSLKLFALPSCKRTREGQPFYQLLYLPLYQPLYQP